MVSGLSIIIRREFMQRVARKSFIISTLLMPIFMGLLMLAPALMAVLAGPENKTIAVIDNSGQLASTLQGNDEVKFVELPGDVTLDDAIADESNDAVLVIGDNVISDPDDVLYYSRAASSMQTEGFITSQLSGAIENIRLRAYDIENLPAIIAEVKADVSMRTYRMDKLDESETSSVLSYLVGTVMSLILYMFIMLYGQMVMTSIIEEKNNRVLELVVSSVKPSSLMLGKIVGVGLVAVVQLLVWGAILAGFSQWVMPSVVASVAGSADVEGMKMLGQLGDTGYILTIFGYLMLFLVGGYLFYSSIYAAIGSAVDNINDAGQLQTVAIVPIIMGLVFSMMAINDPNSTLAVWLSMLPFTSPMVMMARIPFGIPGWEVWVSAALLYLSFFVMVWIAAKIYRVGIFMYGKKPTFGELVRWARYK